MASLFEAASITQVPKPVEAGVINTLRIFQAVLKITLKFYHAQYANDKRGQIQSDAAFRNLKAALKPYRDHAFVKPLLDQINSINTEKIAAIQGKRQLRKINVAPLIQRALQAWKTHNVQAILSATGGLTQYQQQKAAVARNPYQGKFNPFYRENPLFFISNGFLEKFELNELTHVANLDLTKFRYSYMPLPEDKRGDFQYLGYYMLKLTQDTEPVTISGQDVRKYLDLAYGDSDYKSLINDIQDYLHNNNRKLIPKILGAIEQFPEIKQLNDQAKNTITQVYRGIGGEPSGERAVAQDRENRYVATSTSKYTAKNFAYQIGHLERASDRRTEDSIVITYQVGPESILLDTTIFGGVFGEGEVLIDATRAAVEDYERI